MASTHRATLPDTNQPSPNWEKWTEKELGAMLEKANIRPKSGKRARKEQWRRHLRTQEILAFKPGERLALWKDNSKASTHEQRMSIDRNAQQTVTASAPETSTADVQDTVTGTVDWSRTDAEGEEPVKPDAVSRLTESEGHPASSWQNADTDMDRVQQGEADECGSDDLTDASDDEDKRFRAMTLEEEHEEWKRLGMPLPPLLEKRLSAMEPAEAEKHRALMARQSDEFVKDERIFEMRRAHRKQAGLHPPTPPLRTMMPQEYIRDCTYSLTKMCRARGLSTDGPHHVMMDRLHEYDNERRKEFGVEPLRASHHLSLTWVRNECLARGFEETSYYLMCDAIRRDDKRKAEKALEEYRQKMKMAILKEERVGGGLEQMET